MKCHRQMTAVEMSLDEMTTQNDVDEMYIYKMARCPKNYFDRLSDFIRGLKCLKNSFFLLRMSDCGGSNIDRAPDFKLARIIRSRVRI